MKKLSLLTLILLSSAAVAETPFERAYELYKNAAPVTADDLPEGDFLGNIVHSPQPQFLVRRVVCLRLGTGALSAGGVIVTVGERNKCHGPGFTAKPAGGELVYNNGQPESFGNLNVTLRKATITAAGETKSYLVILYETKKFDYGFGLRIRHSVAYVQIPE